MIRKPQKGSLPNLSLPIYRSLEGYWLMNEGGGSFVQDLSGSGREGTFQNSTTWASGEYGPVTSFDQSTSDYIGISSYFPPNEYTKAAWVYRVSGSSGNNVLSNGDNTALWAPSGESYALSSGHNGSYGLVVDPTGALPTDQWIHVAATYDGDKLALYKNGIEVDSATGVATPTGDGDQLQIGAWKGSYEWNGYMDQVMLFSRSLTSGEIQYLRETRYPGFGYDPIELWTAASAGEVEASSIPVIMHHRQQQRSAA